MMKWVEIATNSSSKRIDSLTEWLKKEGVENEATILECTPSEFPEKLEECKQNFDAIRIGAGLGEICSRLFTKNTVENDLLKVADCIFLENGEWWPKCTNYEALCHLINNIGGSVDLEAPILVVGAGGAARLAIAAFTKLGIKEVNISNRFIEQAQELIADLKTKNFGVKFNVVPKEELVLLPGTNGVVVNTTPFFEGNEILPELYYFNFLRPQGVAVDFTIDPAETPLLMEASAIGAITVSGYEITALADFYWVKRVFNHEMDLDGYRENLKQIFSKPVENKARSEAESEESQQDGTEVGKY